MTFPVEHFGRVIGYVSRRGCVWRACTTGGQMEWFDTEAGAREWLKGM
jgi:hypothetical protein